MISMVWVKLETERISKTKNVNLGRQQPLLFFKINHSYLWYAPCGNLGDQIDIHFPFPATVLSIQTFVMAHNESRSSLRVFFSLVYRSRCLYVELGHGVR